MGKKGTYCMGCKYEQECKGYDRMGHCPKWVANERVQATQARK